jgi:hypothetical protein
MATCSQSTSGGTLSNSGSFSGEVGAIYGGDLVFVISIVTELATVAAVAHTGSVTLLLSLHASLYCFAIT